jgi:hypothetical protein
MLRSIMTLAWLALLHGFDRPSPVLLRPGHPLLDASRVAPRTDTTRIVWTMNGQQRAGPIQIESIRRIERGGVAMLEHRIAVHGGRVAPGARAGTGGPLRDPVLQPPEPSG